MREPDQDQAQEGHDEDACAIPAGIWELVWWAAVRRWRGRGPGVGASDAAAITASGVLREIEANKGDVVLVDRLEQLEERPERFPRDHPPAAP
jgi:hypothetical protein